MSPRFKGFLIALLFLTAVGANAQIVSRGLLAAYPLQDCSGTTVSDISGNQNNGSFAAGLNSPAWTTGPCRGLVFAHSTSGSQWVNLPPALSSARTIMVAAAFGGSGTYIQRAPTLIGHSSGYSMLHTGAGSAGPPSAYGGELTYANHNFTFTSAAPYGNATVALSIGNSSTNLNTWYVNGQPVPKPSYWSRTSSSTALPTTGYYQLSGDGALCTVCYWTGEMYYALFYSVQLTDAEVAQNHAALAQILASRGIATTPPTNLSATTFQLSAVGDSRTFGSRVNAAKEAWPVTTQFRQWLPAGNWSVWNWGFPGATAAFMRDWYPAREAAKFAPKLSRNTVIFWAGVNDYKVMAFTSATMQPIVDNVIAACRERKAAMPGVKILLVSEISQDSGHLPVSGDVNKNLFNSLLRAQWQQCAEGFVDLGADPVLGADGASLNLTYFVDQLHPTPLGQQIVGNWLGQGVAAMWTHVTATNPVIVTGSAYQMLPGDSFVQAAPTSNSISITLPDCIPFTGRSFQVKNTSTAATFQLTAHGVSSTEPITGSAGPLVIPNASTAQFLSVLNSPSTAGCHWVASTVGP